MRENLIRRDLVECVLGLGPGLFYNAPMEACVVVCRTQKTKSRRGRFLFIDGINEIARERPQSFLKQEHQSRVLAAYKAFADEPGFAAVVDLATIQQQGYSLSIPLSVARSPAAGTVAAVDGPEQESLASAWAQWKAGGEAFWQHMDDLSAMLDGLAESDSTESDGQNRLSQLLSQRN